MESKISKNDKVVLTEYFYSKNGDFSNLCLSLTISTNGHIGEIYYIDSYDKKLEKYGNISFGFESTISTSHFIENKAMKGEYDLLDNLHKNVEYQTNSYGSIFLTIFEGGEIVHV
ncbi:hypothetical protein [Zunongwangia sp.]|uniref:hypothetical protein n=1 Tax=Zunongwangia sp. TaxID=1965325 RepID=UPI003AA892EF